MHDADFNLTNTTYIKYCRKLDQQHYSNEIHPYFHTGNNNTGNMFPDRLQFHGCIVSEENKKIPVLDKSGNDYCDLCKSKLSY